MLARCNLCICVLFCIINIVLRDSDIKIALQRRSVKLLKHCRLKEIIRIKKCHILTASTAKTVISRKRGAGIRFGDYSYALVALLVIFKYSKRIIRGAVINADYLYLAKCLVCNSIKSVVY